VIACPDQVGIVAKVSAFVAQHGGSLLEANYHTDNVTKQFFMRNEISADSLSVSLDAFKEAFQPIADAHDMTWYMRDSKQPRKVALLASHASHCLADLLHRWRSGDLLCDVTCVISNHENLRSMVEWHDIPFHYVPMPKDAVAKAKGFAEIESLIDQYQSDTVVLARYMQIIPPAMCDRYPHQLINIHHSFLPSFIGADPYQKAFERGVKLIGATCHYVTDDLDEGPIHEQDVPRVGHKHDRDDMVRLGKDVEARVLAQGLRYHLEDRVIVDGNKTVIFD
jgi:formyltetrahydrofolate deformylase